MLKLKSFKISEGEEASKFLETNVLHGKSSILVSNGEFVIPYEDGLPPTKEQMIIMINEDKNMVVNQLLPITHSQKVMSYQIEGIAKKIASLKDQINVTPKGKADYDKNKVIDAEISRLTKVQTAHENTINNNQAEVTRLVANIAVYDQTLKELQGESVKE